MSTKTYKHSSGLLYEVTGSPFFGPKARAIEALKAHNGEVMEYPNFIDYLRNKYPEDFKSVEWVRFHDFKDIGFDKSKFNKVMRLAIINVAPVIFSRDKFFNERNQITIDTGWYPLIMGSRINFRNHKIKRIDKCKIKSIGKITHFNTLSNSTDNGISFELLGENGKYLFDFGYKGTSSNDYLACFLSHSHSDHSNGLIETVKNFKAKIPIVSSKIVSSFIAHKLTNNYQTKWYSDIYHIDYNSEIVLQDGLSIKFIPIFHSPGSLGFIVKDIFGTSFFYFGDVCLKNGYSNNLESLIKIVNENKTQKNILLFDAAMIGRKQFISEEDTPDSVLREFANNSMKRNIIFFSNQPENSIYSFLSIYNITQKDPSLSRVKLIVSESLMKNMGLIIEPIILNNDAFKDPVFNSIFGKHKSNPIESQRLYPLSSTILNSIPEHEKLIILAGIKDIRNIPELIKRFEKSDVILAGTFALRENLPNELVPSKPRVILRVASEDWSFHSKEEDIKEFILSVSDSKTKIYLFHNFFQRVIKFIKENGWGMKRVIALSERNVTEPI